MANTLLTSQQITREAARILHNEANFIGTCNRQHDKSFAITGAKIGSQLKIRMPNEYVVRTGRVASPQNTEEVSETLTLATMKGVDMSFYSDELTLSLDDFSDRIIKPAMSVLAASVEADALDMVKDVYNATGTPGTTPASQLTILNAGKILTENAAPISDRTLILNPAGEVAMVNALSSLFNYAPAVSKQYLTGQMKHALGFDWYSNALIPVLTCGSRTNTTPRVNGATQAGKSLICDGFGATVTIKKGDIFTLANVLAVHPETKTAYSYEKQFTVTADAVCVAGAVTLSISPSITTSGAKQNVNAGPADDALLTFAGTASVAYPMNVAYHKDAFVFVSADLEMPKNMDMSARVVIDNLSMRFLRGYDITQDQFISRIDILYGYLTVRSQLACRIWG
jgi:hypothetical protein